jgi:hypothetical protein
MTKSLPARPNLENLKKQAKSLLKSHDSGDPTVCAVLRRLHRFSLVSDREILTSKLSLADAHYALAMDYDFTSWNALKEFVSGEEGKTRFLHRMCGDLAAETLKRSGAQGQVRVWYDAYCGGPTPADVSDDEWLALRGGTVLDRLDTAENAARFFREMYEQLEEYRVFDEVVLWFDACLFDQTILIQHLDWYSRRDIGKTKLSLVCIGEFPGMQRFIGFAQLRPEQMVSLLHTRHEVTKRETDLAVRAWAAYRSPDPAAIEGLLTEDTTALPYLAPAFRRHFQRFPSLRNGLNRQEQESLEAIAQGHSAFSDIFAKVWEMEDLPYFNEGMLLPDLLEMVNAPQPLLVMDGLEFTQGLRRFEWPFKKIIFTLTDTGRDVLAGTADSIRLNGIHRWFGGVHVQGRDAAWRWDEENGRLLKTYRPFGCGN